jgi:hypothetical protein
MAFMPVATRATSPRLGKLNFTGALKQSCFAGFLAPLHSPSTG